MPETTSLYTLCYPSRSAADRQFIDEFRREHDIPFQDVVAPHFSMVFGCSAVPLSFTPFHMGPGILIKSLLRGSFNLSGPINL